MTLEIGVGITILSIIFSAGVLVGVVRHSLKDMATKQDIEIAMLQMKVSFEKSLTAHEKKIDQRLDEHEKMIAVLQEKHS